MWFYIWQHKCISYFKHDLLNIFFIFYYEGRNRLPHTFQSCFTGPSKVHSIKMLHKLLHKGYTHTHAALIAYAHLSLDFHQIQAARIHFGPLLLESLWRLFPEVLIGCPAVTCKRCPHDVWPSSCCQPSRSPRSFPAPPQFPVPPSSQKQCIQSRDGTEMPIPSTAKWGGQYIDYKLYIKPYALRLVHYSTNIHS